ncbi:unnamed protein product [Menidia menidia]|uniref:(Atlantic silverside) hypothetical protein n=1 Tax=Menidia menidia TaxID=238744 RepID=A0A8S4AG64_9TELE|nr:unnamed protein product [Menidia menidia]
MGNTSSACQMSNYSRRNVRAFITEEAQQIDAFITSQTDAHKSLPALPGVKKFSFRKEISCVRVLASQTQEVPWEPRRFLSVFVEDEDDENVCCKQIMLNMALSAPVTVLLYDV